MFVLVLWSGCENCRKETKAVLIPKICFFSSGIPHKMRFFIGGPIATYNSRCDGNHYANLIAPKPALRAKAIVIKEMK